MNSVNKDKNLSNGKLSKALSEEAGACLQIALHDAKPLTIGVLDPAESESIFCKLAPILQCHFAYFCKILEKEI